MEVKFVKKPLQCLRPFYSQLHSQEQTQEVRLPDAYPDIGKVLGCWGQVMVRSKEWRSSSMGANCGVMAWVLYTPEDGTQPRVIDVWIPFQCRWDFPEASDDGIMILHPILANLDARGISARKFMVRSAVDTFAQAFAKLKTELSEPHELPEDVQLLIRNYPVELPVEAGEKQVQIEEILSVPANNPKMQKLICYALKPSIMEQKVLGNRLVFHGQASLHVMYLTEDGQINHWNADIPFSQYTELDRDYAQTASAWLSPIVTAMELEITDEGQLQIRAGIAVQYVIFDRSMLDVIEDAFSPKRDVTARIEDIRLPMLLDSTVLDVQVEASISGNIDRFIAVTPFSEYPALSIGDDVTQIRMDGQFQTLYQDTEEQMMADTAHFRGVVPFQSASENQVQLWPSELMQLETLPNGDKMSIHGHYPVEVQVYSGQTIPTVTELELGEIREPDPDRPSVILRRAGEEDLWAIAKGCGSTVSAIKEANQLTGEPENGRMLLIPIS